MEEIRIAVALCPHVQKGKPSGYYLLAQRLFPRGAPILVKQQFAGFNGGLVVTANHEPALDTVLKLAVVHPTLGGKPVTWLSKTALYPMSDGFRMYLPGSVLCPRSAEAPHVDGTGIFKRDGELFYLEVPFISADVLLGRKELSNGKLA